MAKQHDKQFKPDAIQYYEDHKDSGVSRSGYHAWLDHMFLIQKSVVKL